MHRNSEVKLYMGNCKPGPKVIGIENVYSKPSLDIFQAKMNDM